MDKRVTIWTQEAEVDSANAVRITKQCRARGIAVLRLESRLDGTTVLLLGR